ncbi:MAG TPA: ABC transporter permease [Chryseolinea sp.]|nr:ABC transporter permease [Chryseolinea sp.]
MVTIQTQRSFPYVYKSYFISAWRNLLRNKAFGLINISGLALGIASGLVIMLWVVDEKGIDAFHENNNNLYVVFQRQYYDGIIDGTHATPGLLADEVKKTYPEVMFATSTAWSRLVTFEVGNKLLKETGTFASPDFFSAFSFPLLSGTKEYALKSPVDIAISRKMAEDFFGSVEAAYGQSIRYENRKDLKIKAVFENLPSNTSMKFDYLLNWETFLEENEWARKWGNNGANTYLVLQQGADPKAFESKFQTFLNRHEGAQNETFKVKLGIQKYSEQYLNSKFENGEIAGGRVEYVTLFSIIAVFIVLIACINSMNLTTANSIKRGREIGVRKVMGAIRSSLVHQFIGEAVLTVLIAFAAALLLVFAILPVFNTLTQKQIQLPVTEPYFWLAMVVGSVLTGLLSGSYPALYQSAFNPVRAIKGSLKFGRGALWFRKGLVVFQFVLSIMLIVGTIVISRQVRYVQGAHLGYDRENLVYIPLEGDLSAKYNVFKEQGLSVQGVKAISRITNNPTVIPNLTGGVMWEGKDPNSFVQFSQSAIDYDFISTMKMDLKLGRDFSRAFKSDSVGYIVNETAVALMNYEDPVGMPFTLWGMPGTIVGVVKDFHFSSLHDHIRPIVLRLNESIETGWVLVRTEPGKTQAALAGLQNIANEINPQFPFTYKFSDEEYQRLYITEHIIGKLSNAFAFLAIFISCLGLLGLTMFTTRQRRKEIGIRKVLGAPGLSLFGLLSKELFLLVILSMAIASPLAWYSMNIWLKSYAYRIDVTLWMFILAGTLAILIALVTTSFQIIKAVVVNPTDTLRSE